MSDALVRATLDVAGYVDVRLPDGSRQVVRIVRATDWRGSPLWSTYLPRLGWSRLWRLIRRDRRWFIEVGMPDDRDRPGEVRAIALSRGEAIQCGTEIVAAMQRPEDTA